MEFTSVGTYRETWFRDIGPMLGRPAGALGRRKTKMPVGLRLLFWCFVAVLAGTFHLSAEAATIPNVSAKNVTTVVTTLTLSIPEEHLYSNQALLVWTLTTVKPSLSQVVNYYVTYQEEGSNSKTVITVDGDFTSELLRKLAPSVDYKAFVKAVFNDTDRPFINSALERFRTPERSERPAFKGRPGLLKGLITLLMMFTLWAFVVVLFWRQWRIIRQLEARPSRTHGMGGGLYQPRNLGNITVVTDVKDSVLVSGSPKHDCHEDGAPATS